MSYTGTTVYFPPATPFDAVRDALAGQFEDAKLESSDGAITLAFDDVKVIRVSRDDASHVRVEAKELAGRAQPSIAAVLGQATQRYEIVPHDPGADYDDMYNELLFVFEALRGMPDAVGIDPFDGAMYLDAPVKPAKQAAKRSAKKTPAAKRKKPAAKKPTKKPATKKRAKR